jgi:hypothetical protein
MKNETKPVQYLDDGTVVITFQWDKRVRPWIPAWVEESMVSSLIQFRACCKDHEKIWPCKKYTVIELLENSPLHRSSGPALIRLLTRDGVKLICEKLLAESGSETLEKFLLSIADLLGTGILRSPKGKSIINDTLKKIERNATALAKLLDDFEKQAGTAYRYSMVLKCPQDLIKQALGYYPHDNKEYTEEEVMDRITKKIDRTSHVVRTIAVAAQSSMPARLKPKYIQRNKDGFLCETSLIYGLSELLNKYYGKPLHEINASLVNIVMGYLGEEEVSDGDVSKRLKARKRQ